jgi:pantoate kinase
MRKAAVFVPAHISGFFQPCEANAPERAGSRNCGPCLSLGVLTDVRVKSADQSCLKIFINGRRAQEAKTTLAAVDKLLRIARGSFEVEVNHFCQIPVGAGYGASGAGAIGAVLALSKALGLRVPREKLTAMAHVAEVKCRTGLGDVGAQVLGGLVIGVRPGAPPHGRWRRIPVPRGLKVICATVGPLSTREFLSDAGFRRRASELGGHAIEKVMKQPTPEEFMVASREFADGLGILDEELKVLIQKAEEVGAIGVSQVMIGRAVFALARGPKAERVKDAFLGVLSPEQVMVSKLNLGGAKFL